MGVEFRLQVCVGVELRLQVMRVSTLRYDMHTFMLTYAHTIDTYAHKYTCMHTHAHMMLSSAVRHTYIHAYRSACKQAFLRVCILECIIVCNAYPIASYTYMSLHIHTCRFRYIHFTYIHFRGIHLQNSVLHEFTSAYSIVHTRAKK